MATGSRVFTTGEANMHAELSTVPDAAYDLVLEPYGG
jgi:hypothetical protein